MDSYVSIASKVLTEMRQPMSARQILQIAYQLQIVPDDLYGKTQHKTLQARIAEDILHGKAKSRFVRTGPGRFFLRSFLADKTTPERHRKEYFAPVRAEQLKRFDVLCVKRDALGPTVSAGAQQTTISSIPWWKTQYRRFSEIHDDLDLLHLRVMIVLRHGRELLVFKGAALARDALGTVASLGVSGVVKREDKSLFAGDRFGLEEAAYRILIERLRLPHDIVESLEPLFVTENIQCVWNIGEDLTDNIVAAILVYNCFSRDDVSRSIEDWLDISWDPLPLRVNDLDRFDLWSQYLLKTGLLSETYESP